VYRSIVPLILIFLGVLSKIDFDVLFLLFRFALLVFAWLFFLLALTLLISSFSSFFSPCFVYLEDFSFLEADLDASAVDFCFSAVGSAAFTYVPLTLQLFSSGLAFFSGFSVLYFHF
jgi:hypothetical protein